jgi:hypothetical protein
MNNTDVTSPSSAELDVETACQIALDRLWSSLRAQVVNALGESIGGGKSPSDLVQSSIGSYFKSSAVGLQVTSTQRLHAFLRFKLEEKIAAHMRYIKSQKRDISREEVASDQIVSRVASHVIDITVKDLADRVMTILDSERDPALRRVYYLGIVEQLHASDICDKIHNEFSTGEFGSVRKIQRKLKDMRRRLRAELD